MIVKITWDEIPEALFIDEDNSDPDALAVELSEEQVTFVRKTKIDWEASQKLVNAAYQRARQDRARIVPTDEPIPPTHTFAAADLIMELGWSRTRADACHAINARDFRFQGETVTDPEQRIVLKEGMILEMGRYRVEVRL